MSMAIFKKRGRFMALAIISDNPGVSLADLTEMLGREEAITLLPAISDLKANRLVRTEYDPPILVKEPFSNKKVEFRRPRHYITERGAEVYDYLKEVSRKLEEKEVKA